MRNRLVITLALGVLAAVLTAGVVNAQGTAAVGVKVDLPGGTSVGTACVNGVDDDGDGAVDYPADPGCSSPADGDESGAAPAPATTTTQSTTTPSTTTPSTTTPSTTTTTPSTPGGDSGAGDDDVPSTNDPFGNGGAKGKQHSKTFKDDGKSAKEQKKDKGGDSGDKQDGGSVAPAPLRNDDGTPTRSNPTITIGSSGPAPIGVPNFVIDQFSIPPFLIPIYQACGTQYGIPWEVLASINRIETAFGTNLNVSSAGALGWMQFMPATWQMYGVDANNDGRKDPYNPVDAICAAARYLNAAGGTENLYDAIFAYNHADWYVREVLLYAKQYGDLPGVLVDAMSGITEGAHFPVAAKSRYADDISERAVLRRSRAHRRAAGNAADVITDSPTRRGINIYSKRGAPVVAVNDGVIVRVGQNKKLGKFIVLRDAYGNQYTYAELGSIAKTVPAPRRERLTARDFDLVRPGKGDAKPKRSASATTRREVEAVLNGDARRKGSGGGDKQVKGPINTEDLRPRIAANEGAGGFGALPGDGLDGFETFKSYFSDALEFDARTMDAVPLRKGTRVIGGTVIGKVGRHDPKAAPHLNFAIKPAGRGARTIDPKPILDGWKLLEATAIYRAAGKNPFDEKATVGQVLLASKTQLQRRVLADSRMEIYSCGRDDVRTGQIDRRVMAMLEYLTTRGFRLTISSLKCGHSIMTASGNVSAHSTGDAVDIAAVNGIPIIGNQGKGSITEVVINELLKLQGAMEPAQIISLMDMGGPTFVMSDHADHIHVGYTPDGSDRTGKPLSALLSPKKWDRLLDRISKLDQPTVPVRPSKYALPAKKKQRGGKRGD